MIAIPSNLIELRNVGPNLLISRSLKLYRILRASYLSRTDNAIYYANN